MKSWAGLLVFILLPLLAAVAAVGWAVWRQAPALTRSQRALPATTQIVSGRAGWAWSPPVSDPWAAIGFVGRDTWFGATLFRTPAATAPALGRLAPTRGSISRPFFHLAVGDAVGGRMNTTTNLRSPITGPAVITGGLLYAPTGPTEVTAVDLLTLRPAWTTDVSAQAERLAVAGGRVVARTGQRVTCLDAISGNTLWITNVAGATAGPALNGRLTCVATANALHVLDAATGKSLRKVDVPDLLGEIVLDGDRAFASGLTPGTKRSVTLYAINVANGSILWKHDQPETKTNYPAREPLAVTGLAVSSGTVVFALQEQLVALDAATGKPRWFWRAEPGAERADRLWRPLDPALYVGKPTLHQGVVYASWWIDRVSGWDAASGREVWRYQGETTRQPPSLASECAPVPHDGLLLCVTGGQGLSALKCDLIPRSPPPKIAPAARAVSASWAVGAASTALLIAVILAVLGLWRLMIATACLALCCLAGWAWVNSYGAADFVGHQTFVRRHPYAAQAKRGITSRDGALTFGAAHDIWMTSMRRTPSGADARWPWVWTREPADEGGAPATAGLTRFAWTKHARPSGTALGNQSETSLTVPHWAVMTFLAVPPLAWLSGVWRDRKRHPHGHCRWCGYDLRASEGRCPECGRAVAPARVPRWRAGRRA